MSEEINFDDVEFGEPIEEREPSYRDGYIRGIYRARNIIDSKQKEIERLNSIINNDFSKICREKMIDKLSANEMILLQEKEIERLRNIINELEKWLRSEIKRIEELQNPAKSKVKPYGEEYNNYTLIIGAYDNVLDKLQELKGEDKE